MVLEDWTLRPPQFAFNQNNVRNLIETRADIHFDLVIYQDCSQDSWLMFAHKFNAPIVVIGKAIHLKYFFLIKPYRINRKKKLFSL